MAIIVGIVSCVISLDFSRHCSHIAETKRFGARLIGFDLPQGRVSVRGQGMPLLCLHLQFLVLH